MEEKRKISFNLPVSLIDYLDLEAKRQFPQQNRTQVLQKIVWFYSQNKPLQWERVCVALIHKIRKIFDGLIYHTSEPKIKTLDKLYKIKDLADHISFGLEEEGILSGVNFLNASTSIEDIKNKLIENL